MAVGEGSGPVSLENGASGAVGRRGRGRSSSGSMYAFLQRPEVPMVSLEVARAAVGDCGVAVEDKTGALQVRGVEIREEIDENVDDRIADGQDAASTGNGKKVQKCGFQLNWKTQHNNKNYGNAQNSEEHRSLACSSESHELVNTEMTGPIMRTEISPEISRGSSEVQALNPELLAYNGSVPVAGDATTLPPNVLEDIGQNVGELEICHENKFEQRGVIVDHFTVTGEMKEETSGSANTRQLTNLPAKEDDFFMPSSRKRKIPQEDVMTAESKMQPASKARVSKRQQRRLEIEPQQTIIRALPGRKKKATATPAAGAEEPVRENKSSSGMDHDLRKDARLAAEENARLSAGKPIHPFFVRHRPVQQSNMDVESTFGEDILIEPSLPRHVTQNAEEQVNWNSCGLRVLECKSKPKLLEDDDWTCSSLKCKDGCSSFLVSIRECFTFAAPPDQSLVQLLEYLKVSSAKANEVVANEVVANEVVSDTYPLERLKEKYGWYCARSSVDANIAIKGSPKKNCARRFLDGALNALWTDVYQPQSSQQVCGNEDSVKFLNDWLYSWQLKILSERKSEGTPEKTKNSKMDSDRGWFQDDSDSDGPLIDSNELQNTLLLTGPVGCGKSAAVYACANEQGFDVIEINASDIRTGALIKHKFGEAFESHGLNKWSCLDADTKYKCADGKFTNARARLQWDQSVNHEKSSTDSLSFSEFQRGKMTLILFEEVDTVFDEDKGFMAALVQLAKTAKRPIILTSNRREPLLPQLEKIKVNFRRPAVEDMVVHACLVCTSSGVPGNPWLIERLVRSCEQDIRKLMTLLQFWGQGFCLSEKGNQRKPSMGSERNLSYQGCLLKDSLQLCTGIQNSAFNNDLKQPLQALPGANHLVVSQAGDNSQSLVAHIAGGYRKWLPQALWCFESDAQYCLLPQLFPFSFPCPLAGSVAEKVSVAVQEAVEIAIIASEQSAKSAALLKADLARASRKEKRSLKKMLEFESSKATEIEENRDICFTSIQEQLKPHDMSHEGKRKSHVKRKMVLHESDDDSKLDCDVLPQNIVESLGQGTNDGSSMEGDPNFKRKFETSQNLANLKLRGSRKFKRLQKLSQNEEATTIAASDQKFQVGGPTELTLSVGDLSDVQALCFQQNHNFADSDIGLDEKGSAGYLDPVKRHWLEVADSLKSSSFSCSKCYHVAALKINCALADFEDTLSCCDVMSSIPNSVDDSRNAEVAAQLAHANLHYFAEVSNETVELLAPDRGTNPQEGAQLFYTSPCHEQNLSRQQRHTRLKEALFFPNPRKARIGLTEPSFCDYTSYMARIATLEDLGKVERLGRKQRRGSPHYLSDLGVPEEGIHALRQLSAFGDPLIH